MMAKKWKTIDDDKVRHIWRCSECKTEAQIAPERYAGNGTPVCCDCDIDMEYLRTDIYQPPAPEMLVALVRLDTKIADLFFTFKPSDRDPDWRPAREAASIISDAIAIAKAKGGAT